MTKYLFYFQALHINTMKNLTLSIFTVIWIQAAFSGGQDLYGQKEVEALATAYTPDLSYVSFVVQVSE